jgi:hypothetical protein
MVTQKEKLAAICLLAGLSLLFLAGFTSGTSTGVTVQVTATPAAQMMPPIGQLMPPTLPPNPTQADLGGEVYYYVCMTCHGDQGQGLSPEWVESLGLGKNACWESKCHGPNHPPEGFVLPRTIPGVVGDIMLYRFSSAQALHDFIQTQMPWQAPGSLQPDEYWQLTAFLMRWNGLDPGKTSLNETNAARFTWDASLANPVLVRPPVLGAGFGFWLGVILLLAFVGVGLILVYIIRRTDKK